MEAINAHSLSVVPFGSEADECPAKVRAKSGKQKDCIEAVVCFVLPPTHLPPQHLPPDLLLLRRT
ncbi:hypothetical protein M413DRAFT_32551 [Hebeloma cylindrosporum]|uniref:Uncharacterized protein n=1 Tax=Hebeloma cylindrosporum TaxID=76867 RepID=A0A0C2XBN2_HEBCY|nr:hypothetical protein M413DRAFT_32551 [Hebeloma cylindrosporum h7]